MNRKIAISVFVFFSLTMGSVNIGETQVSGLPVPVITHAFASKQIWPGETWKVYLNASHPNGEMKKIYALVEQPGVGPYPVSTIPIKEANQKELSGYIYLKSSSDWGRLDFVTLTLTIQIQDQAGVLSQPAGFPLSFNARVKQEPPPPGVFKEQEIGPIMVNLKTIDGGPAGGRSPFGGR
jgi:hypothetical protein